MEAANGPVKFQESAEQHSERTNSLDNGKGDIALKTEPNEKLHDEFTENLVNNEKCIQSTLLTLSDQSRSTIKHILEQIKPLSSLEKFLIYLKLVEEVSNIGDPLKQPLNPLGSRSEIHRTISWIKTHLEEDCNISLPKQDVYNNYLVYCSQIRIKPLSQADFGKVMKQVYPRVKARRLGTRGNSRYCYSGLRNCLKLKTPQLPDLGDKLSFVGSLNQHSTLGSAVWAVVKKWSEDQLSTQFLSIEGLAYFLVVNCSIGLGSEEASQIVLNSDSQLRDENGDGIKSGNTHREMQLQLQKKIQQKNEANKERKRKIQTSKSTECNKSTNGKKSKCLSSVALCETSPVESVSTSSSTSPTQGKIVCDKLQEYNKAASLPEFNCFQKSVPSDECTVSSPIKSPPVKVAIPRLNTVKQSDMPSSCVGAKSGAGLKYKTIQPKSTPLRASCDNVTYNPPSVAVGGTDMNRSQTVQHQRDRTKENENDDFDTELPLSRERLNSISNVEKDAMDDYLGKNNSQHEEELSKYFNSNNNNNISASNEMDDTTKLSQLRQLLQQNGIVDNRTNLQELLNNSSETILIDNSALKSSYVNYLATQQNNPVVPTNLAQDISGTARRRVSFETPVPDDTVPPSPNTRRKHFSFTPISPGPQSPNSNNNGRQSKCSSTNASPFVSPRNTPVPRCKNNTHQNAGIMLQHCQSRLPMLAKVKRDPDLTVDVNLDKDANFGTFSNKNYLTMSAPPSPMLCHKSVLQKLLNARERVTYTPDYVNQQLQKQEKIAAKLQFGNDVIVSEGNTSYRSQSVPLHQMIDKPSFNELFTTSNEFNELDPMADSDTVGVIINSLDENQCDNNNIFDINIASSSTLAEYGLTTRDNLDHIQPQANFMQTGNISFNEPQTQVLKSNVRQLYRSQSIDVTFYDSQKCMPSRSVPVTPLPISRGLNLDAIGKNFIGNSSRSYPSTPLLPEETFHYNLNKDCLLNGQPIKNDENFINFDELNSSDNLDANLGPEDPKDFLVTEPLNENEYNVIVNPNSLMSENVMSSLSDQNYHVSTN